MDTVLEQRVIDLEQQVAQLTRLVLGSPPGAQPSRPEVQRSQTSAVESSGGESSEKMGHEPVPSETFDQVLARIRPLAIQNRLAVEKEYRESGKDWRSTVGMMPDDESSRSAERLGREWRERANRE